MTFRALYVHIPFCLAKCHYCDFTSFANVSESERRAYVVYLSREAALWHPRDFASIRTIYLGGGTPTILPIKDLTSLVTELRTRCPLAEEVTVECNPGTVSAANLCSLRAAGVTRLSVGVESFDDRRLAAMGRIYNKSEALAMLAAARRAGFTNLSIDLIYGLPEQTVSDWLGELQAACSLDIEHLSVYGLTLADSTPWGQQESLGNLSLPDEDQASLMMAEGIDYLTATGFEHYEIANFARDGRRCQHNLTYWQRQDYLALGVAAAGLCGQRRWVNQRELNTYQQAVIKGLKPVGDEEFLTTEQVISEALFLGLRLMEGIDLEQFKEYYHIDIEEKFAQPLQRLETQGLVERKGAHLRLTKRGMLLANEVFVCFI